MQHHLLIESGFRPGLFFGQIFLAISLLGGVDAAAGDLKKPTSLIPVPRHEYNWMDKHDALVKKAAASSFNPVFFGDSITEGMPTETLKKFFGPKVEHFGIGGDRTQHLLWRLENGELNFKEPKPKTVIVLIGTNNISEWPGNPASTDEEIFLGVQACLNEFRKRLPAAKILLLGILPRDQYPESRTRRRVESVNKRLKFLADNKQIYYADIGRSLLEPDGKISADLMPDFLHPNESKGYKLMFDAIAGALKANKL